MKDKAPNNESNVISVDFAKGKEERDKEIAREKARQRILKAAKKIKW